MPLMFHATRPLCLRTFIQCLRQVCQAAVEEFGKSEASNTVLTTIDSLTDHSGSLLAHESTDHLPWMLLGHWRSPNMRAKYVREKNKLVAKHVSNLATVSRRQWRTKIQRVSSA